MTQDGPTGCRRTVVRLSSEYNGLPPQSGFYGCGHVALEKVPVYTRGPTPLPYLSSVETQEKR